MIHPLVQEYKTLRYHFENLTVSLFDKVKNILIANEIQYASIYFRTKEIDSLAGKVVLSKAENYEALWDITDLSGICVVTYFEEEIRIVSDILKNNIVGFCGDDLVDKMKISDPSRFGYRSYHMTIPVSGNIDTENSYISDKFRCEIQIRSMLMDMWTRIEHKYVYKKPNPPMRVKRGFARLSSLIELAENELSYIYEWHNDGNSKLIDDIFISNFALGEDNNKILDDIASERFTLIKSIDSDLVEKCRLIFILGGYELKSDFIRDFDLYSEICVRAMRKYYSNQSPSIVSPMMFTVYYNLIRNKDTEKLLGIIRVIKEFEDEFEIIKKCSEIMTSFEL
ncbi:MAG: hypothetical protein IAE99_13185 [Rhodothermales bacterium]|nr:hypothetical protein [Rhodothermales bacterium]